MDVHKNRYPGAQPFTDDDLSRRVFFGRENASRLLADKIVTNRLVVVYGRSGLGKTSLLNAGLAPLLRAEGYLPLFLRVNDTKKGPFQSLLEVIPSEASRQGVEYTSGMTDSLWSFFKTAEFWRGDLLLKPVLILDQFEELFTLQHDQARARLLDELSYLIRSVPPPSAMSTAHGELSDRPPEIRILLSLREEYLGLLEEAADQIPQIFDARFRLAPLDFDAAEKAIISPAGIDDPTLGTRPFTLDHKAVTDVLNYLSQRRTRSVAETKRYVEPFQLQLICQRIERIAAVKQRDSSSKITVTMADIGGEPALTATLRDFYHNSLLILKNGSARRAARRLCEEYLISAEGRRLSLEENEICRQLSLTKEMLGQLVSSRLLRIEHRSDSTYYELSHDALVEPILASQHRSATITGWLGIASGTVLCIVSILVIFYVGIKLSELEFAPNMQGRIGQVMLLALLFIGLLTVPVLSLVLLRSSARSLLRQRRAREAMPVDPGQARQLTGWVAGPLTLIAGAAIVTLGFLGFILYSILASVFFNHELLPVAIEFGLENEAQHIIANGIGVDLIAYIVTTLAVVLIGGRLMRWGIFRLVHYSARYKIEHTDMLNKLAFNSIWVQSTSRIFFGSLFLVAAVVLGISDLLGASCLYFSPTFISDWFPLNRFTFLSLQCTGYYGYYEVVKHLIHDILSILCCLLVAVPMVRKGLSILPRSGAILNNS
ncbi:hypothetical protein [Nitrosomonas communis]|uniref:nSTAND1 domain-containing NTPase n=1 Tax=Nitrosomonas communis TaxID=44574 RepID=UPI003D26532E